MSLEERLAENTAALNRNSDLLERVVAGQEAAMAKLESNSGSGRKRSTKKDEPAAGDSSGNAGNEPADTGSQEGAAAAASEPEVTTQTVADIAQGITSEAQMKEYVSAWTGGTEDQDERAKRVGLLKAIAGKLGVSPNFASLTPHAAKTVFFIERAKALGVDEVDVEAAYDFDGDPAQTVAAAAPASDFE
jgi:hypothetical protein